LVVAAVDIQPAIDTVTLYVPLMATVADALVGSSTDAVYPLGPVHANVAPEVADGTLVKFNVDPSHIGELLLAVMVGTAFTVTFTVTASD
jgi:hypothetical protein